ncbi:MAG: DUF4349 domain-containing protein [Acidimicrobiales bacterium]
MLSILFALVLVAAACSGDDEEDAATSFEEPAEDAMGDGGEEGGDAGALVASDAVDAAVEAQSEESGPSDGANGPALGTGGADVGALQPIDIGRDIVFTAQIGVAVDDVVVAGRQALTVIESLGGLLFGQETSVADTPRTVLVFKVAPEQFQTAVARLGEVGVLTDQVITADDVTERIVDLESRIVTAEASVERLRTFLEGATGLEEVASLERELLVRETDLELLRGQLRTLRGQVDLATITVVLTQARPDPGLTVEVRYSEGPDEARESCSGDEELTVGEGDDVTVCVEVRNDGDTMLTELDVVHRDLALELDDFAVVVGDLAAPLEPGAAIVLVASFEAGPSIFGSARASAVPVDANGVDLGFGTVEATGDGRLDVEQELTLPGVAAAFSAGWNALLLAANVVILALAVAVPFLWIPFVVWLVWHLRVRRSKGPVVSTADESS